MSDDRAKANAEEEDIDDAAPDEGDEPVEGEEPDPDAVDDEQPEVRDDGGAVDDEDAQPVGEDEGQAERRPETGRRPHSASDEIRSLRRRAQAAEKERDEERRQAAQLREQQQPRQVQETPQQRQERLALMDPDQRTAYLLDEQAQWANNRFNNLERVTLATADKSGFDAVCARKPHFDAVREDVEAEFQRLIQQGRFVPRETLAKYVIGDRIDKRGGTARAQQGRRGRERIAGQRTRPAGGRSDVAAERRPRGDGADARRKRLEDQEI